MIGKSKSGSVNRDGDPQAARYPWHDRLKTTREHHSEISVRNDVCRVKALSGFMPTWVEPREYQLPSLSGMGVFLLYRKV